MHPIAPSLTKDAALLLHPSLYELSMSTQMPVLPVRAPSSRSGSKADADPEVRLRKTRLFSWSVITVSYSTYRFWHLNCCEVIGWRPHARQSECLAHWCMYPVREMGIPSSSKPGAKCANGEERWSFRQEMLSRWTYPFGLSCPMW